ncbi:MAG: amino acid ABC transporter ATP-binding protein [Bacteroidetes bacterium]|nr:amino acid ABC transporter ATP-binding protein [Bacteroidota bacterium]
MSTYKDNDYKLEVHDLKKSFSEHLIFEDFTFRLKKGEILAVLGDSGSGKSTLIQCISFLERPDTGKVRIGDLSIDLTNSNEEEIGILIDQIRLKIGVVFQDFNLWPHMSVMNNLIEAPIQVNKEKKKNAKKRALEFLKEFGLEDKENVKPNSLSGGQKQRVAIIRALMMNPEVMLFDEPTSALDPNMVGRVVNIIKKLSDKDITIIVATHEIPFARQVADKVMYIADKKIVEKGYVEILDNPKTDKLKKFLNI